MDIVLEYGTEVITIAVIRRAVKNITIKVHPDLTVTISANESITIEELRSFADKKIHWIYKKLKGFENYLPIKDNKSYVSGESILYLGKQYRLKVVESESDLVKWYRGYIYIMTRRPKDFDFKRKLFQKWLRSRVELVTKSILDSSIESLSRYGIKKPRIKFRQMKSRWGSYIIANNTITINTNLIRTSKICIEYVIMHELIHVIYPNHSKEFYNLLTLQMPDWRLRKNMLDEEFGMININNY